MPKFTIIIPTYNCSQYIKNALESIYNLDFNKTEIEIIVIDDGSIDNTQKIISTFETQKKIGIKYFSKPNGGWGSVINFAKINRLVTGDYVTVLDADDALNSKVMLEVDKVVTKNFKYDLVICDFYKKTSHRKFKVPVYAYLVKEPQNKLEAQTPFCIPLGKFIKKEVFYTLPLIREKLPYQDSIYTATIINQSNTIRHLRKPAGIYNYKRLGNSMSEPWEGKRYQTEVQLCLDLIKLDAQEIVAIHIMRNKFRKLLKNNFYTFPVKRKFKFLFIPWYGRWLMQLIFLMLLKKRFRFVN